VNKIAYYTGYMEKQSVDKKTQEDPSTGKSIGIGLLANVLTSLGTAPLALALSNTKETPLKTKQAEILKRFLRRKKPDVSLVDIPKARGSRFAPYGFRSIAAPMKDPAVLAHEAGHALGPQGVKNLKKAIPASLLYGAGKSAVGLATLYALFSKDKAKSNRYNTLAAVASIPMLAEETRASVKGYKMLKKLKTMQKLRTFAGLPSYAAVVASPFLTTYIKDKLGGYNTKAKAGGAAEPERLRDAKLKNKSLSRTK